MQESTVAAAFSFFFFAMIIAITVGVIGLAIHMLVTEYRLSKLDKTKPVETKAMTPTMQNELDSLIAQTKGKFFSITFVKKDGATRVINGKDKYQRLLKGGVDSVRASGYVPFVNRNTETWASAHKDAVVTFRCGSLVKEVSH
jgi:hypothetical protein